MKAQLPAQPNQSLIDGLRLLQRIAVDRAPASVTGLARELRFEATRVNRLLKTLAHTGFAHRTRDRRYTAGSGLYVLAAQALFGSGFLRRALPHLEALTAHGHIVALGALWGDQVSYLYHWTPGMPPAAGLGRLALYPAAQSSIGVVLLAEQSDRELRRLFPAGVAARVMRAAQRARSRGYGEVMAGGKRSLAIAIGAPAYAGLALSGAIPAYAVARYCALLRETRPRLEAALAGKEA